MARSALRYRIVVWARSDQYSCRELPILRRLSLSTLSHAGQRYIPTLIDSFYVDGPNRRHLHLVMDAVGPTASLVQGHCEEDHLTHQLARVVPRQLMLAGDYLHQCGVAHGGILLGLTLRVLAYHIRQISIRAIYCFAIQV